MATSTLLENIRVNNPKVIEEYVDFREHSYNDQILFHEHSAVCDDENRIRQFMEKALSNIRKQKKQ
ncbi:MAG: hypothetical protein J6W76_06175 [Spirochaetales bacterium]|nr:hypothetical protein [Spirochaetales bacterium]